MTTKNKISICLALQDKNKTTFCKEIGVSKQYLSRIETLMEEQYKELLPKTKKALKVQNELKRLINFHQDRFNLFDTDTHQA